MLFYKNNVKKNYRLCIFMFICYIVWFVLVDKWNWGLKGNFCENFFFFC